MDILKLKKPIARRKERHTVTTGRGKERKLNEKRQHENVKSGLDVSGLKGGSADHSQIMSFKIDDLWWTAEKRPLWHQGFPHEGSWIRCQ